jgi:ATP-binding cassette subfamily F protein uup
LVGRRPARAPARDPAPPVRGLPAAPQPAAARRRLSFHQKHALDTLPDEIARLGDEVQGLQRRLEDAELYARDRRGFDETSRALAAAQSALTLAEEKWLELALLREEIEGG